MISSYNLMFKKVENSFHQKSLSKECSETRMPFEVKAFHFHTVQMRLIDGFIICNLTSCSINCDIFISCKMYFISNTF